MATFIHDTATEAAVISTGDNFYKVGVESAMDDHFNASFESVYKHVSLQTLPWYAVLGNHDHFGSVHAQTAYTLRSERWRMPGTYYTQQLAPNLLAIFLDTSPFVQDDAGEMARGRNKQDPQAQLKWFQAVLREAAPEKYFLIVGHHNMYTMSTGDHLGTKEIRDAFEPIIKPYQKRLLAYVSGHEHSLMHMQPYEGVIVDHFLSGAGSKITDIVEPSVDEREKWYKCCGVLPLLKKSGLPRTVWGAAKHGFFTFTFDGTTFSAKAIDEGNNVLYEYEKNVGIS